MKKIIVALAVVTATLAGSFAVASTANAGWIGREIGGAYHWNHSSGRTIICRKIGAATFCS